MRMKLKTKILNMMRVPGRFPPVERILVYLAQLGSVGVVFAKMAPNNYQYPKNSFRICERGGIRYRLDISDYGQYCLYFSVDKEPREKLYKLARNGTTVIDVGTNIGETLLNFARINTEGQNIGFEPVPATYETAKNNVELNRFNNIVLVNMGLSDVEETLTFNKTSDFHSGGVFLTRDEENRGGNSVETVRLDQFVAANEIVNVSLIKIDVEGFEMNVLKGASETLRRFRPILFMEVNNSFLARQNSSALEVFEFLTAHGYGIEYAVNGKPVNINSDFEGKHFDVIGRPVTSV